MLANSEIFIDAVETIDCAVYDRQHGVVGVSWFVDVKARGAVDENFFVHDFSSLKKIIRNFLRTNLDHRLLLPITVNYDGNSWSLPATSGDWSYVCPTNAVTQLAMATIDRASLGNYLTGVLQKHFDATIQITLRSLEDRRDYGYSYHNFNYTHGLPGHDGNCQRLLHGHCGLVKISFHNYKTATVIPKYLHFANSQHIVDQDSDRLTVAYTSKEGKFIATIPRSRVAVLPGQQASIEMIGRYLSDKIEQLIGKRVPITCYEGASKGAHCY